MANLTNEQRKEYRALCEERRNLLKWLRDNKNNPNVTAKERLEKRTRLEEVRKRIKELVPRTEKQQEATKKWIEGIKRRWEKEKNQKDKPEVESPKENSPKNGEQVIQTIVKKTADEHKKELRTAPKKEEPKPKVEPPKENPKEEPKAKKKEKGNSWIWIVLIVGIISAFVGVYILIKKYGKEIKSGEQQSGGNEGNPEPSKDDGFWWLPRR